MAADDSTGEGAAAPPEAANARAKRRETTFAQSLAYKANKGIDNAIGLYQVDPNSSAAARNKPVIPIPVVQERKAKAASNAAATAATGVGSGSWFNDWLQRCFFRHARSSDGDDDGSDGAEDASSASKPRAKVNFLALLSYSTTREKWLMALGLLMAGISGLAVPTWLVLLAKGLNQFSNLGFLINAGVNLMDVVQQELNKLVVAFAILGGISLLSGSLYVSIWTYTGEKQALRIKERYVRSAFHQGEC